MIFQIFCLLFIQIKGDGSYCLYAFDFFLFIFIQILNFAHFFWNSGLKLSKAPAAWSTPGFWQNFQRLFIHPLSTIYQVLVIAECLEDRLIED